MHSDLLSHVINSQRPQNTYLVNEIRCVLCRFGTGEVRGGGYGEGGSLGHGAAAAGGLAGT